MWSGGPAPTGGSTVTRVSNNSPRVSAGERVTSHRPKSDPKSMIRPCSDACMPSPQSALRSRIALPPHFVAFPLVRDQERDTVAPAAVAAAPRHVHRPFTEDQGEVARLDDLPQLGDVG